MYIYIYIYIYNNNNNNTTNNNILGRGPDFPPHLHSAKTRREEGRGPDSEPPVTRGATAVIVVIIVIVIIHIISVSSSNHSRDSNGSNDESNDNDNTGGWGPDSEPPVARAARARRDCSIMLCYSICYNIVNCSISYDIRVHYVILY